MPHGADRVLTTHVGSLIRPPKLIEFWRSIEDGKPYDEAAFEAVCVLDGGSIAPEAAGSAHDRFVKTGVREVENPDLINFVVRDPL